MSQIGQIISILNDLEKITKLLEDQSINLNIRVKDLNIRLAKLEELTK